MTPAALLVFMHSTRERFCQPHPSRAVRHRVRQDAGQGPFRQIMKAEQPPLSEKGQGMAAGHLAALDAFNNALQAATGNL